MQGLTVGGVAVPIQVDADGKVVTTGGAVVPNDLLDGDVHQDTVVNSPVEGDIIVGIDQGAAGILWDVLPRGSNGQYLQVQSDNSLAWVTISLVSVITGEIKLWGTASAPSGYLECDGSAVSRTTYAALFAVIGTTFGVGDGSTTFNLPNLKGRVPVGRGTGSGLTARTLAATGGEETHVLTDAEMPSHTHTVAVRSPTAGAGASDIALANAAANNTRTTSSAGSDDPHENMQPFIVMTYIIKT